MPPINIETLFAPKTLGGREVLDIELRNYAIEIMWLKKYLDFSKSRPLWALVVDETTRVKLPSAERDLPKEIRVNVFLQSWKTLTGTRTTKTIRALLKTAQQFNVRVECLQVSPNIQKEMPIWHHKGADPKVHKMLSSQASKCLIKNHHLKTVGEADD